MAKKERTIVIQALLISLVVATFGIINDLWLDKFTSMKAFLDPGLIMFVVSFVLVIVFSYILKLTKVNKKMIIVLNFTLLPILFALWNYLSKLLTYTDLSSQVYLGIMFSMFGFVAMLTGVAYNYFSKNNKELIRNYIIVVIALIILGGLSLLSKL